MLQENSCLIDWDDLENENIDPLDPDELPELPKIKEEKKSKNQIKWILQYNDKHYECTVGLPNLAYFICWIMKWRERKGLRNEKFTWIRCDGDGNEIFDYKADVFRRCATGDYQKHRFLLDTFINDVFYKRVRPLAQKVVLGKKEKKRAKFFFVMVGEEKISLGRRFTSELFRPLSEFASNQNVKVFYAEKGIENYLRHSDFLPSELKRRSERIIHGGDEIISIIKNSLKKQGLLENNREGGSNG